MEMIKEIKFFTQKKNVKKAIILLHGYGANCHDLAPLSSYLDPLGEYSFYFPNGPLSPAMMGGFGACWFDIRFSEYLNISVEQKVECFASLSPKDFESSLDKLVNSFESIFKNYDEVILGGFSQGSMMALHLASRMKMIGKIKKVVLLSSALLSKQSLNPIEIPVFQSHGKMDPVLDYEAAKYLKEYLIDQKTPISFHSFSGGHEIPMEILTKVQSFL